MTDRKNAQTIIEVIFLIIVIMLALLFVWKYIVPAVGGYFKSLDQAADESQNDPFAMAPPGLGPGPECQVSSWFDTGLCGGGCPYAGHTNACPVFHMLQERTVSGADCPQGIALSQCVPHEDCCSCWTPTCNTLVVQPLCCGQNVQGIAPDGNWPLTGPLANSSCRDGDALQVRSCGSSGGNVFTPFTPPTNNCIPDPNCSIPCGGTPGAATQICQQSIMGQTVSDSERKTTRGIDWHIVSNPSGTSTAADCTQGVPQQTCQYFCAPGTIPDLLSP